MSKLSSPVKSWASVTVMPMMPHMSPSAPGQRQTRSDPVPSVTLPPSPQSSLCNSVSGLGSGPIHGSGSGLSENEKI